MEIDSKPKKICIVGTAPDSAGLGPYANPDWQVWACSPGTFQMLPKIDVFFELHRWTPGTDNFPLPYVDFLKNFDGQVVMSKPVVDVKNCRILDVDALVEKYSPYFFTSSIAWMLAMAIDQKPEHISLFGVDMSTDGEYAEQRKGCQYFAIIAKSIGIQIGVPPESDLFCPSPLYGVCQTSHSWIKQSAHLQNLKANLASVEATVDSNSRDMHYIRGAIAEQQWQMQNWHGRKDQLKHSNVTVPAVPALSCAAAQEEKPVKGYYDFMRDAKSCAAAQEKVQEKKSKATQSSTSLVNPKIK